MPSAIRPDAARNENGRDDLDNLFDYDDAVEEFLKDLPLDKNSSNDNPAATSPKKDIDEEITIRKKRKPIPKLDENLLTSSKGIPKLHKITKSRLKFRGKGHEFSDMTNLLSMYQLWLDEMYPRAKFRDALAMVEKLGHTKRLQVMRRAWLDETKPMTAREESPEGDGNVQMSGALPAGEGPEVPQGLFSDEEGDIFPAATAPQRTQQIGDQAMPEEGGPDDDELDALLADQCRPQQKQPETRKPKGPFEEDDDDEDELDALLAEQSTNQAAKATTAVNNSESLHSTDGKNDNEYADDEEAMADMDMW